MRRIIIIRLMRILTDKYLEIYQKNLLDFAEDIEKFRLSSKTLDFSYMTESSSIFSANIEGNSLDLNSFHNLQGLHAKPKEREEIEYLIEAYHYAHENPLDEKRLLHTHTLASRTLLIPSFQGTYRNDRVGVFWKRWLVYLVIEAEHVQDKMNELFTDIGELLERNLSPESVFYYASLIHLVFVHVHPFADGNGRSARLLEKWFLTTKLGIEFWKISSEQYYKEQRSAYYQNINLGVNYYELDYDRCLPFLLMLPGSMRDS